MGSNAKDEFPTVPKHLLGGDCQIGRQSLSVHAEPIQHFQIAS
jgi:hypothetical protein